jgi:phage tail-like protein
MKQTRIKRLLPLVFQQTVRPGNPMDAILKLMESLHMPSETALAQLRTTFNPRETPAKFVPYLASWVDLEMLLDIPNTGVPSTASFPTGLGRLRELTATASTLSHWRGTRRGLLLFLQTATGMKDFDIDENTIDEKGAQRPFHLRIKAPAQLIDHRPLIERIIELEKPAYVTYDLQFGEKAVN